VEVEVGRIDDTGALLAACFASRLCFLESFGTLRLLALNIWLAPGESLGDAAPPIEMAELLGEV
jgi:hypothetical protein